MTSNLGEYKKYAIFAPLFVLLETAAGLLLPSIMATIVNEGINTGDMNVILRCGAQMMGIAIIGLIGGLVGTRMSTLSAQGLGSNLRVSMFRHMQTFSFADVDRFSTASLITRTNTDASSLQMVFMMSLRTLISAPFQLVVAVVIVVGYSWKLALIYLAVAPILFLWVTILQRMVRHLFRQMQIKLDNLNATVQENLIAIRVVKSFVREKHESEKFKKANDELTITGLSALYRMILMQPGTSIIITVAMLLLYWVGGHMIGTGEILSGTLLATIQYCMQIMMSIMMFSMIFMQYSRAQASAERIAEVLSTETEIADCPTAPEHIETDEMGSIEFRNVNFRYSVTGTGENVLKNINFRVNPGETVAVVGDTGSGKSSLVNLIPRFYDATEGEILVNGVNVKDYKLDDLRRNIGMVLQKNVLFSGTIRENMLWGREDATDEDIYQALKNAQAYDFVMGFPHGLDTYLAQGGTNVSGGQKQRLCIARAMLKAPSILIMDDSTSAVDSDTESRIRASFEDGLKNCTVIIIAQRISSVASADKILVLDENGYLESVGVHSELMETSRVYKEIYTSQQAGGLANV
jgi:ATP-binding cassette subfamily B protein